MATLGFSAIFWVQDQPDINKVLVDVISNDVFIIGCVAAYLMAYNLGLGPVKHTLLRY